MVTANIKIDEHLLRPGEHDMLKELCPLVNIASKNADTILDVFPIPRLGYSGARLYNVVFGSGRPHVVKIDGQEEMDFELKHIDAVKLYFADDINIIVTTKPYNGLKAAAYVNAKAKHREEIGAEDNGELENRIKHLIYPPKDVSEMIELLYKRSFATAHYQVSKESVNLLQFYSDRGEQRDYLRNHASKEIVTSVLGENNPSEKSLEFMGKTIFNPLFALENFFKEKVICYLGPIHGDLHPRNVIFDDDNIPHLIDFKWANPKGHLMLDFVLLEISLRFFLLPRGYNLKEHFLINQCLIEEDGYEKIPLPGCSCTILSRYHTLLKLAIEKIRANARKVSGNDFFKEYLACMFLVLYGVLRIKYSDKILGVHALALIADILKDTCFGL